MCAACRALWDRRVQTTPFILSCGRVDCTTSFILSCGVRELLRSLNSKPNYNKAPQERSWGTRLIQRDSLACWHWPLGLCLVSVAGLAQEVPVTRVSCLCRTCGQTAGAPSLIRGFGVGGISVHLWTHGVAGERSTGPSFPGCPCCGGRL